MAPLLFFFFTRGTVFCRLLGKSRPFSLFSAKGLLGCFNYDDENVFNRILKRSQVGIIRFSEGQVYFPSLYPRGTLAKLLYGFELSPTKCSRNGLFCAKILCIFQKRLSTTGKAIVVAPFSGLFFLDSLHCDMGKRERGEGIFLNGVVGAWDEGWIRHPRFPAR